MNKDEDEMIFRIDNVFSDEQREKMIEDIEPLLLSKESVVGSSPT